LNQTHVNLYTAWPTHTRLEHLGISPYLGHLDNFHCHHMAGVTPVCSTSYITGIWKMSSFLGVLNGHFSTGFHTKLPYAFLSSASPIIQPAHHSNLPTTLTGMHYKLYITELLACSFLTVKFRKLTHPSQHNGFKQI